MIHRLSPIADAFPTTEVEYADMVSKRYRVCGRGADGTLDCMGVVLEIYRRAGLGLPDPLTDGDRILDFQSHFEEVPEADRLFDLVHRRDATHHVWVVVRRGILLSAREHVGVYSAPLKLIKRFSGLKVYRVRSDKLP